MALDPNGYPKRPTQALWGIGGALLGAVAGTAVGLGVALRAPDPAALGRWRHPLGLAVAAPAAAGLAAGIWRPTATHTPDIASWWVALAAFLAAVTWWTVAHLCRGYARP